MPLEFTHRGIPIRTFDVPCTPFVWVHEETDGHGTAESLQEARAQIDRHLSALARSGA
ncbi:hypothetical protein MU516_15480 [Paracoccus sp. YLB-12]|uniref:Uncharacterized protein n=1 Tax=Paracoccus maritimus TaxID=2933292 RepID=A0ABT2KD25_9RHOB|nr:hypothetical protein [Paracoccus sp. YLB-12]MCT4334266.1 hypothetical protein [Paracoccus sp. YLB-12]